MRVEVSFRVPTERDEVRQLVPDFLRHGRFQVSESSSDRVIFSTRGSPWVRLISLRVEDWPTTLSVSLLDLGPDETGVTLEYRVRPGLHLVGTLDRTVLLAEAASLQDFLTTGRLSSLADRVAPLRRPILTATVLNMLLAIGVVAWVGAMSGLPPMGVAAAAALVGILDGVVIMAFADLVIQGTGMVPRLRMGDEDDQPAWRPPTMGGADSVADPPSGNLAAW